jgi:hypothetical protein
MPSCDIICRVAPQSRRYANGLEAVELFVHRESPLPLIEEKPRPDERLTITFSTPKGDYTGGLRNCADPYLCPDLWTRLGEKITLAEIMRANGIRPGALVRVRMEPGKWTLLGLA